MKCKERKMENTGEEPEVTFAYSSTKAILLQLYVKLAQIVDVPGMSSCPTFTIC
jgi:hypothetical protein